MTIGPASSRSPSRTSVPASVVELGIEALKPRLGDLLAVCLGDRQRELEGESQALLDVGARPAVLVVGPLMDGAGFADAAEIRNEPGSEQLAQFA